MEPTKIEPYEFSLYATYVATEMSYQRNGSGGNGFWTVRFGKRGSTCRLIGVVFDDETDNSQTPSVAIVNPSDLSDHYRGDIFAQPLRDCIKAREAEYWGKRGVPV